MRIMDVFMFFLFFMWTLYEDIILMLYHMLCLENDILFLPHAFSHEMNSNGIKMNVMNIYVLFWAFRYLTHVEM